MSLSDESPVSVGGPPLLLSSFGSSLHYLAPTATRDAFGKAVATFRQALIDARAEVDGMDAKANPKRKAYARALLEAQ